MVLSNWENRLPVPSPDDYPDIEPSSTFPIIIMLSAWQGSDKYKLIGWTPPGFESHDLPKQYADTQLIQSGLI